MQENNRYTEHPQAVSVVKLLVVYCTIWLWLINIL